MKTVYVLIAAKPTSGDEVRDLSSTDLLNFLPQGPGFAGELPNRLCSDHEDPRSGQRRELFVRIAQIAGERCDLRLDIPILKFGGAQVEKVQNDFQHCHIVSEPLTIVVGQILVNEPFEELVQTLPASSEQINVKHTAQRKAALKSLSSGIANEQNLQGLPQCICGIGMRIISLIKFRVPQMLLVVGRQC